MPSELVTLNIDAQDPLALATFWAGVLNRPEPQDSPGGVVMLPGGDGELALCFLPTDVPKTQPNQMHFDLASTSWDDQQATVDRALGLGASHLDVGQLPEEQHVVLADPEGNEFCVVEPTNRFLADTARIGALSCDGSEAVGHFWSEALGWPLVWDQDEETAIQSPRGGTKISWGGPPFREKTGKNRWHLDLAPLAGTEQQDEVERLESLGARRADIGQGDVPWVVMADVDGNEFCVLAPA
ncbi:VOC family protein [Aeromicrobium wangtongii]|uniref:VOC family protein n=1 Tax=Aeromicrobium wangtongii TaxID=2969247 RepID=A0ABY5M1N2_9ACTN|nr:VOC family protein [Aeromicrobium wangtongii]MCD9198073.1 VOC family protein [Aeromicrobium wangtongii]UUP12113.1 VOC family protein [Aeromicrobium wangtongii]